MSNLLWAVCKNFIHWCGLPSTSHPQQSELGRRVEGGFFMWNSDEIRHFSDKLLFQLIKVPDVARLQDES